LGVSGGRSAGIAAAKRCEVMERVDPVVERETAEGQSAAQGSSSSRRSLRHFFSRLRAYLFLDPLILAATFVFGVIALMVSLFDSTGRRQHAIARAWSKVVLRTLFSSVIVIGAENLEGQRAAIYAANHISAIDIPLLYAYLPFQFRII